MTRAGVAAIVLLTLGGCSNAPEKDAALANARIDCALDGAGGFVRDCTVEEMPDAQGTVLVVGREGAGYRRLRVTGDGRGVEAADGAEPARVAIISDGLIEVSVGADRYRLPANTGGN